MGRLIEDYEYIIIDNEAGFEHLSRRTTRRADVLLVVSDGTKVGLKAAGRISGIVDELKIDIQRKLLIINRMDEPIESAEIKHLNLHPIGNIPVDNKIEKISLNGGSLIDLEDSAVSIRALIMLGDKIWQAN